MELRQLRAFAAAAEQLSFTRAAQELAVSQPAVSQHVAALEKELGHSLFRRSGRNIALTEDGQRMYRYVRKALDLLEVASSSACDAGTKIGGTLHIASCTVPPESFLSEVLAAFLQLYPDVHESLVVSDSAGASRAVETGAADLGFVVMPQIGSRLRIQPVACQEYVLVVAPTHSLAKAKQVTAAQLRGQPFIFREPGSGTRYCVEQALQEAGITPDELSIVLETNSNDALRGAVKQGSGIAFLSRTAVHDDIAQGLLVAKSVSDIHAQAHIYLITDTQRIPSPAARAFLSFLLG